MLLQREFHAKVDPLETKISHSCEIWSCECRTGSSPDKPIKYPERKTNRNILISLHTQTWFNFYLKREFKPDSKNSFQTIYFLFRMTVLRGSFSIVFGNMWKQHCVCGKQKSHKLDITCFIQFHCKTCFNMLLAFVVDLHLFFQFDCCFPQDVYVSARFQHFDTFALLTFFPSRNIQFGWRHSHLPKYHCFGSKHFNVVSSDSLSLNVMPFLWFASQVS